MENIINFNKKATHKGKTKMSSIKKQRMLEIESITSNLLKDIDFTKTPYVDIVSLVEKDDFIVEPSEMDIETTGVLLVSDDKKNKKRLILVNTIFKNPENEPDVVFKKSRFITAHEYGHFILHKKDGQAIYAHRDTYHRTDPLELEADYFARSLLMPVEQFNLYSEILKQMSNNDEDFTIEMLSKIFRVTRNKVKKRMGDLLILN